MSIRSNGSYIGPRPAGPSLSAASGIWDLRTAERQQRAAAWPIPAEPDPDFASVSLLLHMDGSGATFTDASGTPKTITASGGATQSTAQSKFGGKSLALDGTGDYLTVSDENTFDVADSDFVIEFWMYATSSSSGQGGLYSKRVAGTFGGILLNHYGDTQKLQLLATTNGSSWAVNSSTSNNAAPRNQWLHIAVSRSGTTIKLFIDGTQAISTTLSGSVQSNASAFVVGAGAENGAEAFQGYIDDFRVTIGTDRGYTGSTITVPTEAFPDQ